MKVNRSYIYAVLVFILIIIFRDTLDFTQGDRDAYLNPDNFKYANSNFKNFITTRIFSFSNVVGEFIFCFLYYKNVFILNDLIIKLSPFKEKNYSKFLQFTILLALFSPITILFTSFAGKDLIAMLLSSIFCIYFLKRVREKQINFKQIISLLILFILIFSLRELTGIFIFLLSIGFIIFYTDLLSPEKFIFIILIVSSIIFFNSTEIYENMYDIFWRQSNSTISPIAKTFTNINPFFELRIYFQNFYQAFLGVNLIHLNDSLIKSFAIFVNTLLNYFFGILYNFSFWIKKPSFNIYSIYKFVFIIIYFSIYAFLSQNNAGGAVRYYSSIVPILVTFLFVIMPKKRI